MFFRICRFRYSSSKPGFSTSDARGQINLIMNIKMILSPWLWYLLKDYDFLEINLKLLLRESEQAEGLKTLYILNFTHKTNIFFIENKKEI